MKCTNPFTVGFHADGKTLCWSPSKASKQYVPFQLPCGKCISCRLEYARQWAVRCVHEAQTHKENCFITLTYNDDHIGDGRLDYTDFQNFMKRLRFMYPHNSIGYFVTGEYGEKTKRKHWHACIFNWSPPNPAYKYSNERGDKIYTATSLDNLWGKGIAEFGNVTFESAGYCARYAAKKLVHGNDQDHNYQPISKKSCKNAIGKKWLEHYYKDVFNNGHVVLPNGQTCAIPRYYEKWFKKNHPQEWEQYTHRIKADRELAQSLKATQENIEYVNACIQKGARIIDKYQQAEIIQKDKFNRLQQGLKL